MPNYRRARVPGGTYSFTVNLLERRRTLLVDHVEALCESFRVAHARPFTLLAWVILPDHLHCVWRLPEGDDDNATRWRHIKSHFSRALPAGERLSARRQNQGRARLLATALLGAGRSRRRPSAPLHRLCPHRSPEARLCRGHRGLAAFLVSSLRESGTAACRLGWGDPESGLKPALRGLTSPEVTQAAASRDWLAVT